MLKILKARLQQYRNQKLLDVQAGFRKCRGSRDQIANIPGIIEKAGEFQKKIYFCFIDYPNSFDCVDHSKLWNILKEMGIPDHLSCLLRQEEVKKQQLEPLYNNRVVQDWEKSTTQWQQSFQQHVMTHAVKGFSVVNETEVDFFLEFPCFLYDPANVGNLISGSSAFSKPSLDIWSSWFTLFWGPACRILSMTLLASVVVHVLSRVWLFATPWTAACQASLTITNSWSLVKLMSIESVMPSNHLILCCSLLLPPSIFPSIRVFSNESALCIRWPKYWVSASASVLPMNILDWFPLGLTGLISLQFKGLLKSLLRNNSLKALILQHSGFFMVQLSHHTWLLEKL